MKMYVLVRNDLTKAYQAVQGGHALAEFLLTHKEHCWKNYTLIYLGVRNEQQLEKWVYKLEYSDIDVAVWREPDMDNEITAISTYVDEAWFKKLILIGGESMMA